MKIVFKILIINLLPFLLISCEQKPKKPFEELSSTEKFNLLNDFVNSVNNLDEYEKYRELSNKMDIEFEKKLREKTGIIGGTMVYRWEDGRGSWSNGRSFLSSSKILDSETGLLRSRGQFSISENKSIKEMYQFDYYFYGDSFRLDSVSTFEIEYNVK